LFPTRDGAFEFGASEGCKSEKVKGSKRRLTLHFSPDEVTGRIDKLRKIFIIFVTYNCGCERLWETLGGVKMFKGFSVCVALLLLFAGALFSEEGAILSSSVDTTDSASIRSPETVGLTLGTGSENVAVRNKLMVGSTADPSYTLDVSGITYSSNGFHVATKDDITGRTNSGFWQTSSASTAEGWPENATWYHLLASTHSNFGNYYSMQFAADFYNSNDLFYRSTNGSGTTGWNRIWHSGNDGSGSGLDADLLDGHHASYFAPASGNVTGSGSSNYIPKWTGAHTLGNSIIYDNGNVGIGTTSPGEKLDIEAGEIQFDGGYGLDWENDPWGGGGDDAWIRYIQDGSGEDTELQIGVSNDANDNIAFYQAGAERMTIYNGNVGIGTTSPSARLQVRASGNNNPSNNGLYVYNPDNSGDNDDAIICARVGGSSAGDPFISWDINGEYGWSMGIDNSDANKLKIGRSWSDPATNTALTIQTNGNVGIGTTSPGEKLDVNGSLDWTEMYWDSGENIKMRGAGEFSFDFADGDGNDYWHVWDPPIVPY